MHARQEIVFGRRFLHAQDRFAGDERLKREVHAILADLADGTWRRGADRMRVGNDPRRPLCKVRLNDGDRLLYEGPILLEFEAERRQCIWVHEYGRHDEIDDMISRALGAAPTAEMVAEATWSDDAPHDETPLTRRQCWWLPWTALVEFESFQSLQERLAPAIKLTRRQMEAIRGNYPLLIQGQAGSGKSVLLCHHMSMRMDEDRRHERLRRRLFLSYSPRLVERAQKDVNNILQDLYGHLPDAGQTEFLSHEQLLRRHAPNADGRYDALRRVSWPEFRSDFFRGKNRAELAWHSIRAFFKGAAATDEEPPLGITEYERIPEQRRPFERRHFEELFQTALHYQRWLQRNNRWDDLDLARAALRDLRTRTSNGEDIYSEIYCDEGQDLTLVDYECLMHLCGVHDDRGSLRPGLVVAADPFQTINPSGFQWTAVKDRVYTAAERRHGSRLSLQVTPLEENFRCSAEVVQLANALLHLRSPYSDDPVPEQAPTGSSYGQPMVVVADAKDQDILDVLRLESASTAIIVLDTADRDTLLASGVSKGRIFTVVEAKGLEFQNVIAWRLFEGRDALWSILTSSVADIATSARVELLYYLNTIYVAATRAMQHLVLIESENGAQRWQWAFEGLVRLVQPVEVKATPALNRSSSANEWRDLAENLFGRELYGQAATAYDMAKESRGADKARAFEAKAAGRFADSARWFVSAGDLPKALEMFFQAGQWGEVVDLGPRVGKPGERLRARAWHKLCEAEGRTSDATRLLERTIRDGVETDAEWLRRYAEHRDALDRRADAAPVWEQLGEHQKAADCYTSLGRWEDAVAAYSRGGMHTAGVTRAHAEVAYSAGDFGRAAEVFRKLSEWDRLLAAAEAGGLPARLEALRKLKRHGDALVEAERQISSQRNTDRRRELQRQRMEILADLGRWTTAREAAERLDLYDRAVQYGTSEGLEALAIGKLRIQQYKSEKNFADAAREAESLGLRREAIEYGASAARDRGEFAEAARLFAQVGLVESAWRATCSKHGYDLPVVFRESPPLKVEATEKTRAAARDLWGVLGREDPSLRQQPEGQDRLAVRQVLDLVPGESGPLFRDYWLARNREWFLRTFRDLAEQHGLREEDPAALIRGYLSPSVSLSERERGDLKREIWSLGEHLGSILRPDEVAQAWELVGSFKDAANAYSELADQAVGHDRVSYLESALRMRTAQRDYHLARNEPEKAAQLNRAIERLRRAISTTQEEVG